MGKRARKPAKILGLSTGGVAVVCGLCLCLTVAVNLAGPPSSPTTGRQNTAEATVPITAPLDFPPREPQPTTTVPVQIDTAAPTQSKAIDSKEQIGQVVNVIDGDTIDVEIDGQTVSVRYIGVNTPERGELCYQESADANVKLVVNQTVRLVKDVNETDRYGRLLRHVYVNDVFVNAELVRLGYAEAVRYPPDTSQAVYPAGSTNSAAYPDL